MNIMAFTAEPETLHTVTSASARIASRTGKPHATNQVFRACSWTRLEHVAPARSLFYRTLFCFLTLWMLSANSARAESRRVAVLDFKSDSSANGNDDWTMGLADFVELALQKEGVTTLERRQIRLVLGERELQAGGMLRAIELQKRGLPAVDSFVSGNVRRLSGNEFELTVELHRADNATLESALTQRGLYPAEWLTAIDSIARQISGRLRSTTPSPQRRSEFESLTWLPEAALPFFKGLEYYARGD